jgi:hypothetical protein
MFLSAPLTYVLLIAGVIGASPHHHAWLNYYYYSCHYYYYRAGTGTRDQVACQASAVCTTELHPQPFTDYTEKLLLKTATF